MNNIVDEDIFLYNNKNYIYQEQIKNITLERINAYKNIINMTKILKINLMK